MTGSGPAVHLQPAPGQTEAQKHPREFSLLAQANGKGGKADGHLASVPRQDLQGLVREYGSDGQQDLPDDLPFDKLAVSLHRGCTHAKAAGSGDCLGFAAHDSSGQLSAFRFELRPLLPGDVRIQVAYCGICHSGLAALRAGHCPPQQQQEQQGQAAAAAAGRGSSSSDSGTYTRQRQQRQQQGQAEAAGPGGSSSTSTSSAAWQQQQPMAAAARAQPGGTAWVRQYTCTVL